MKITIDAHKYLRDIVVGNISSYLHETLLYKPHEKYDNLKEIYSIISYWQIKDIRVEHNIIIIDFHFVLHNTKEWIDWSLCYYVRDDSKFRLEHDYTFNSTFIEGVGFLSYSKFVALVSMIGKSLQIKDKCDIIFDDNDHYINCVDDCIPHKIDLLDLENLSLYENLSLTKENFNEICFTLLIKNDNISKEFIEKYPNQVVWADEGYDSRQYLLDELDFNAEDTIEVFKQEYCDEDGWYTRLNKPTFC